MEMGIQGLEVEFQGYDSVLTECISQTAIREGQRVHAHMIKTCYEPPVYLRTRLIVLYKKCRCLDDARRVLDEMPERNVVSWTAMISGYSQRGYASEALHLFVEMLMSGTFSLSFFFFFFFYFFFFFFFFNFFILCSIYDARYVGGNISASVEEE